MIDQSDGTEQEQGQSTDDHIGQQIRNEKGQRTEPQRDRSKGRQSEACVIVGGTIIDPVDLMDDPRHCWNRQQLGDKKIPGCDLPLRERHALHKHFTIACAGEKIIAGGNKDSGKTNSPNSLQWMDESVSAHPSLHETKRSSWAFA